MNNTAVSAESSYVPEYHAPIRQIKVVNGSARVAIEGYLGTVTVTSTDQGSLEYGYSSLVSHRTWGESVFAFRNAAVISDPPTRDVPEFTLALDEPFAYNSLMLQGIYAFTRPARAYETGPRLVRLEGAPVA